MPVLDACRYPTVSAQNHTKITGIFCTNARQINYNLTHCAVLLPIRAPRLFYTSVIRISVTV